jgi:hypothetical protein
VQKVQEKVAKETSKPQRVEIGLLTTLVLLTGAVAYIAALQKALIRDAIWRIVSTKYQTVRQRRPWWRGKFGQLTLESARFLLAGTAGYLASATVIYVVRHALGWDIKDWIEPGVFKTTTSIAAKIIGALCLFAMAFLAEMDRWTRVEKSALSFAAEALKDVCRWAGDTSGCKIDELVRKQGVLLGVRDVPSESTEDRQRVERLDEDKPMWESAFFGAAAGNAVGAVFGAMIGAQATLATPIIVMPTAALSLALRWRTRRILTSLAGWVDEFAADVRELLKRPAAGQTTT